MNNIEKLQRIRARCVELLTIAEKRTSGKWQRSRTNPNNIFAKSALIAITQHRSKYNQEQDANTDFIAVAAGSAESGWRSTIAAIDLLNGTKIAPEQIQSILDAWPDELLK